MPGNPASSDVTAIIVTTGEATTASAIECIRRQTAAIFDIVEVRDVRPVHKALNHGVSLVKTPYFVQVDSDMLLDPDCVGALRQAMRDNVGIAVGQLRDAIMGSVVGVKLFRTACFDVASFPDTISPDTDFVEAIGHAGWRTVYVGRQEGGDPRTFGEHAPDYQPAYVFRKFLMEGQRYCHRASLGGLRWQLGRLSSSPHPHARLARVALAAGVFNTAPGDALGRAGGSDTENAVVAALVAARQVAAVAADATLPPEQGTLRERFVAAWQIGHEAGGRSDARTFLEVLAVLERRPADDVSMILTLGLCRGFVVGGDPQLDFDLLERLFHRSERSLPATNEEPPQDFPLAEVFDYARRSGLKRFVIAPSVGAEFTQSSDSFEQTGSVASRIDPADRPRIKVPFRPFGTIICTDLERPTGLFWCLDLLRKGYTRAHVPGPFGAHSVSLPVAALTRVLQYARIRLPNAQPPLSAPSIRRMLPPPSQPYQAVVGRILMVTESLGRGGAERQLVAVVEGLQRRGFDVKVLSFSEFDPGVPGYEADLQRLGIEVSHGLAGASDRQLHLFSTLGCIRPEDAARLPRRIRDRMAAVARSVLVHTPEVVHAWQDGPGSAALLAAAGLGLGRIVVQQGSMAIDRRGHPASALIRNIYVALHGRAGVTFINNSLAGAIDNERWIGLPRGRIGVRYNGLLPDTVRRVDANETSRFKASLGWQPDTPVVGTITRIEEVKDPNLWLATAVRILERRPDVRFLFGGYGQLEAATRARAQSVGLGDRIRFIGAVRDVSLPYSAMDVVLLSSAIEGVPNVMIEAQALGRSVVAPDVGGAAEALDEGVTGLIARPRDDHALASAVIRLLDDPAWRDRIREDGPRFVARKFDVDDMVEHTISIYRD